MFFTTLSQLSVGIILCFTLLVFIENDVRLLIEIGLNLQNFVSLALASIGVATIISFSHLGKPSNAVKSLNNLSGSWVSREILALAVYSISLLCIFVLLWKNGYVEYLNYLLALSSVFGLVFLWVMIQIYIIPTIPPWNSWYTTLSFITTTICLGLITILFLRYIGFVDTACITCSAQFIEGHTVRNILISLSLILLTEIVSALHHQSQLQKMNTGMDGLVLDKGNFYRVFLIRMIMLILALLTLFVVLLKPDLLPENDYFSWIYPLLVLLFAQELTGRLLFYSSYFRIGV